MSTRSILSSITTGAVLLGLTGISSPAFAAAPTVTIDSSSSGCGSVTNVSFDGASQTEYMENYWTDGTQVGVIGEITCNGIDFDVEWTGIELYADETVTLTVPALSDLSASEHSGSIDSSWGSDCLSNQYKVGVQTDVVYEEWGDPNSPSVRTTFVSNLASDGTFTVDLIDGVQNVVTYPAQNDSGGLIGESDYESGQTYAEKCGTNIKDKLNWIFQSGEAVNLENKTAQIDYNFDYPVGFDSTDCAGEELTEYQWVWRGQDAVSATLVCRGYRIELESDYELTAGSLNSVTFDVPELEEITLSGTITFAHPECATADLTLVNATWWNWSREGDPVEIGSDGTFSYTGVIGTFKFAVQSMAEDTDQADYLNSLCAITSKATGYRDADASGLNLTSSTTKVAVSINQPANNDTGSDCSLYYPDTPGIEDTSTRNFGVGDEATTVGFDVWCGEGTWRHFEETITDEGNNTGTVEIDLPDLSIVSITGALRIPKKFPANRIRDLRVNIRPEFDHTTGETGGWYSEANPSIDAKKMTYTIDLPVGNYIFGVQSVVEKSKGCYVDSYYPGGTVQFAQPVAISPATSRAPTVTLLEGGRINGHLTFDDAITNDIAFLDDAVYTLDGTSFAWFAGDGTMVDDDNNFTVYQCLPPGQYYYQAGNSQEGIKSQFYDGVTSMANATPITVPVGGVDAEPIDIHFTPLDNGQISGTILDGSGDTLSGYTVLAYDSESDSFQSTVSGDDGTYTIRGLNTPGKYTVVAFSEGAWFGNAGTDYAYFPSSAEADAVPIMLTKTASSREVVDITINESLPDKAIYELWPWFNNMNVAAPAIDFDGVTEALLDGTVTVDIENVQTVPMAIPALRTGARVGSRLEAWQIDVDVNFNSIDDNTAGAYGFTGGDDATGLGDVPAADDVARVKGTLDLEPGLNFVTVTGDATGNTVAVPVIYGTLAPTQLTVSKLNGVKKAGRTVQATAGVWVANPAVTSTKYQWMSCTSESTEVGCKPIVGAKKAKLVIPTKVKGKYLALKVTSSNVSETTVAIQNFGRVR